MDKQLSVIEHQSQRVLLTARLAESMGTNSQTLTNNFNRNKERYTLGKHYFVVEGQELRELKATNQIDLPPNINKVNLWTEKGAWMHAIPKIS